MLGTMVVITAVTVAAVLWPRPSPPPIGEQFRGSSAFARDTSVHYAVLPGGGRLEVTLGYVDELDWGGQTIVPHGDRLVSVSWGIESLGSATSPGSGDPTRREPESQLALTVGDRSFPMADGIRSMSGSGTTVVRVPPTGELGIRVSSGGRQLSVSRSDPDA